MIVPVGVVNFMDSAALPNHAWTCAAAAGPAWEPCFQVVAW